MRPRTLNLTPPSGRKTSVSPSSRVSPVTSPTTLPCVTSTVIRPAVPDRPSPMELPMNEVRLVGQFTGPDRRLFVVRIENLGDLPESLPVGVRAFVLFTAVDATAASEQQLKDFARKGLELGCVWACTWGPDADRVEFAFDLVEADASSPEDPCASTVSRLRTKRTRWTTRSGLLCMQRTPNV